MHAGPYEYSRAHAKALGISDKSMLIISELGYTETTASNFVEYLSGKYGMSKSTIWYNLKKLKRSGMLDFAEKNEEYKLLSLTRKGKEELRQLMLAVRNSKYSATLMLQIPREGAAPF